MTGAPGEVDADDEVLVLPADPQADVRGIGRHSDLDAASGEAGDQRVLDRANDLARACGEAVDVARVDADRAAGIDPVAVVVAYETGELVVERLEPDSVEAVEVPENARRGPVIARRDPRQLVVHGIDERPRAWSAGLVRDARDGSPREPRELGGHRLVALGWTDDAQIIETLTH